MFVHPTSRAMANTEARMAAESIGTERSHAKPMAVHDIPWPLEGTNKKHKKCSRCRFFWNQMVDSPGNSVQIIDSANSRSHQPSTINPPSTIKPPTFQMISPSQLPMPPNPLDPLALPGVIVNGSGLFKGSWRRCHGLIHRAKRTPLNYRKKRQKDRKVDHHDISMYIDI